MNCIENEGYPRSQTSLFTLSWKMLHCTVSLIIVSEGTQVLMTDNSSALLVPVMTIHGHFLMFLVLFMQESNINLII